VVNFYDAAEIRLGFGPNLGLARAGLDTSAAPLRLSLQVLRPSGFYSALVEKEGVAH
jgi:hypothetical protein